MARPHGSVRIGPISLFTLVIILCLAVLAVLSITTARAELTITERQAATTTETYQLEVAGQTFVAEVDDALSADLSLNGVFGEWGVTEVDPNAEDADAAEGEAAEAAEAVPDEEAEGESIPDEGAEGEAIPDGEEGQSQKEAAKLVPHPVDNGDVIFSSGTFDGSLITAVLTMDSGRTLTVALRVNDNGTYTIEQWKTTTQWIDDGAGANLWLG